MTGRVLDQSAGGKNPAELPVDGRKGYSNSSSGHFKEVLRRSVFVVVQEEGIAGVGIWWKGKSVEHTRRKCQEKPQLSRIWGSVAS
jgi:hypothetical protein